MGKYAPHFIVLVSVLLSISACQSTPQMRPISNVDERLQAIIPIHNFNGYDPYPVAESARIESYVNFGAGDGLLRFSIGCGVFATPFAISEDSRLLLPNETKIIEPDFIKLSCDAADVRRSLELADFFRARPYIGYEDGHFVTLRKNKQVLQLNSVAYVLSN